MVPPASLRELRGQPATKAAVLDTIGSAYLGLGLPEQAQPLIEQGRRCVRELYGEQGAPVARSLYNLNRVYEQERRPDRAERLALQSLAIDRRPDRRGTLGDGRQPVPSRRDQAEPRRVRGGGKAAADPACTSARQRSACITSPSPFLWTILRSSPGNAATILVAPRNLTEALEIDRLTRSEEHPQYIRHLARLAMVTHDLGETAKAEPLFRRAVALNQRVLGPEHRETLDAMSAMGRS